MRSDLISWARSGLDSLKCRGSDRGGPCDSRARCRFGPVGEQVDLESIAVVVVDEGPDRLHPVRLIEESGDIAEADRSAVGRTSAAVRPAVRHVHEARAPSSRRASRISRLPAAGDPGRSGDVPRRQLEPSGSRPSDPRKASSARSTWPSSNSDLPRFCRARPLSGWRASRRRKHSTAAAWSSREAGAPQAPPDRRDIRSQRDRPAIGLDRTRKVPLGVKSVGQPAADRRRIGGWCGMPAGADRPPRHCVPGPRGHQPAQ